MTELSDEVNECIQHLELILGNDTEYVKQEVAKVHDKINQKHNELITKARDQLDSRIIDIENTSDSLRLEYALEFGLVSSEIERYKLLRDTLEQEHDNLLTRVETLEEKVLEANTLASNILSKARRDAIQEADTIITSAENEARKTREQSRSLSANMTLASGIAGIIIGALTQTIMKS